MIGIIAAMDVEKDAIVELMENVEVIKHYERDYYLGTLADKQVVVSVCGIGKVASAVVCSQMIEKFKPSLVINCGVAGGTKDFENTLDLLIADRLTYHDWVNEIINGKPSGFATNQYVFETSDKLNQLALQACQSIENNHAYIGPICSGDMFVALKEDVDRITSIYPEAYGCDMESTSIAHCCQLYGVEVVIIRALSDIVVKEGNEVQYSTFAPLAACQAAKFTKNFLTIYQEA